MSGAGQDIAARRLLEAMVERLLSAMANGPAMNCRPHSSRQRIDLTHLARLGDLPSRDVLHALLGEAGKARITAAVAAPPGHLLARVRPRGGWRGWGTPKEATGETVPLTPEERALVQAWDQQHAVVSKLRAIAEDARAYEQDTGVPALALGFPLLSLPPGKSMGAMGVSRRILAPVAFLPLHLAVRSGPKTAVGLQCRGEGAERVAANDTLLVWLAQQAGKAETPELFEDPQGADPWRELRELVAHVARLVGAVVPPLFTAETEPEAMELLAAPTAEQADEWSMPTILPAAVLGLYPTANQGLLRDAQAMAAGEALHGPVRSFLHVGERLGDDAAEQDGRLSGQRDFAGERPVAACDPCQMRAVRLARVSRGLVVHGPPGTGKSQTITNIIADHLARGERVLFVCDKRTALDVVFNRLEHLGMADLCALIHDPKRDWRTLYASLRDRLDRLTEITPDQKAGRRLKKVDAELSATHSELSAVHAALHAAGPDGEPSFHDLVGRWLAEDAGDSAVAAIDLSAAPLAEYEEAKHEIEATLRRAERIGYSENPWRAAAGVTLQEWAARQVAPARQAILDLAGAAEEADKLIDPRIPPFAAAPAFSEQVADRLELADRLEKLAPEVDPAVLAAWADRNAADLELAGSELARAHPLVDRFAAFPLDPDLLASAQKLRPDALTLRHHLAAVQGWLAVAERWHAFLHLGKRRAAGRVLREYGLPLTLPDVRHLEAFLEGLAARMALVAPITRLRGSPPDGGTAHPAWAPVDDRTMQRTIAELEAIVAFRQWLASRPALESVAGGTASPERSEQKPWSGQLAKGEAATASPRSQTRSVEAVPLRDAMADPAKRATFIEGLRASPPRARALERLATAMGAATFINVAYRELLSAAAREGKAVGPPVDRLADSFDTLEDVLRVGQACRDLPVSLRKPVAALLQNPVNESTAAALRKGILAAEVSRRLASRAELRDIDARRLSDLLDRYRKLGEEKTDLVREQVMGLWSERQRTRLVAANGSRLSPEGASLRRRLVTRGKNVVRLRQLIAGTGEVKWDENPLLALCPVWMASPQTVAQIFPRQAMFDIVVFDEASQVRLEESLPVLTRAKRVVVAGDPKQLPPTRFFESALATSEDDEAETDQALFEQQQSQTEDLLAAALGLDIQQCFLDVHYRSRNADLIGFSNEQFYRSRLQPIPGHPKNRTIYAPVRMYAALGIYEDRQNTREAEQVVTIVRELLKRAEPPSIGIACFNLPQRDLILEALDEAASADPAFARKLAAARERRGEASFEGLFVKNLENVQGDERDHIIISTTYAPDARGRFRRNFGPVSQAGGGRRLNVLVTRARHEIHLVTSIPPAEYANLPPIPEGQQASGRWLLYAYLNYARRLQDLYERPGTLEEHVAEAANGDVTVLETRTPSRLAEALANRLSAASGIGSDVYWGNEGFGIDLVLRGTAETPGGVTAAVLCDLTRFGGTDDPVEWEAFRTLVHEQQGWTLVRAWAPQVFRDPEGALRALAAAHAAVAGGLSARAKEV